MRILASEAAGSPGRLPTAAVADAPRSRRDPRAAHSEEANKNRIRGGQKAFLHLQSIDSSKLHPRNCRRMARTQAFTDATRERSYNGPSMRRVQTESHSELTIPKEDTAVQRCKTMLLLPAMQGRQRCKSGITKAAAPLESQSLRFRTVDMHSVGLWCTLISPHLRRRRPRVEDLQPSALQTS